MEKFTNEMQQEFTKLQMKIVFDDYENEKITIEDFNRYIYLQNILNEME